MLHALNWDWQVGLKGYTWKIQGDLGDVKRVLMLLQKVTPLNAGELNEQVGRTWNGTLVSLRKAGGVNKKLPQTMKMV